MYQQGLAPQQPAPAPQSGPEAQQQIKFYKSGLFGFSSAPGRFERDAPRMQANGWRLQFAAYLGTNLFLRRMIVTTWVR